MIRLLTSSILLTLCAYGQLRNSTSYSVPAESLEAAGQRSTSTSYSHIGGLGTVTGISTHTGSTTCLAKHGFIGQLYHPKGIAITPELDGTLNEGSTWQIHGTIVCDDGTILFVPFSDFNLQHNGQGIESVSNTGLIQLASVYRSTTALLQLEYAGVTSYGIYAINVINVDPDNYGSYASDGLPDSWQVYSFGLDNPNAGPQADPDNDGWTNLFEFHAGLIPTDPQSTFHFRSEPVHGQPNRHKIIFSPLKPNVSYEVLTSTTLAPESWQSLTGATITDIGNERIVTDMQANGPVKFYRLKLIGSYDDP